MASVIPKKSEVLPERGGELEMMIFRDESELSVSRSRPYKRDTWNGCAIG